MPWLIGASIIWGFSFGLIKGMSLKIDPLALGFSRAVAAGVFFLPWFYFGFRKKCSAYEFRWSLLSGAIQVGFMYIPYLKAFQYLKGFEVALLTTTTPMIAGIVARIFQRTAVLQQNSSSESIAHTSLLKGYLRPILAIVLAVLGGVTASWHGFETSAWWTGALLVQLANLLFVLGSLIWQTKLKPETPRKIYEQGGLMFPYFIGAILAGGFSLLLSQTPLPSSFSQEQVLVILWLGIVASGLGFLAWSIGINKVGPIALAAANNLKIPISVVISILIFREEARTFSVVSGLLLISAGLWLADERPKAKSPH